jgi:hypothetical protein
VVCHLKMTAVTRARGLPVPTVAWAVGAADPLFRHGEQWIDEIQRAQGD